MRSINPERDLQMWCWDLITYWMTVSTFCPSVRPLSFANSLYSSRKSSTSWSTSPEKCGAYLDHADGMPETPRTVVDVIADVGSGLRKA